mmetsp:Transcript_1802/g.1725  ORF Transcript_1802/g.1725 Transcript_1802/m.1725 type:complete len:221 (+) Transcript_1802:1959-2621(+)
MRVIVGMLLDDLSDLADGLCRGLVSLGAVVPHLHTLRLHHNLLRYHLLVGEGGGWLLVVEEAHSFALGRVILHLPPSTVLIFSALESRKLLGIGYGFFGQELTLVWRPHLRQVIVLASLATLPVVFTGLLLLDQLHILGAVQINPLEDRLLQSPRLRERHRAILLIAQIVSQPGSNVGFSFGGIFLELILVNGGSLFEEELLEVEGFESFLVQDLHLRPV